nr:PDZ domain-containing protein [Planctomycetota bacterium]
PGSDTVRAWHPDGKRVLFSSARASGPRVNGLWLASLEGGAPEKLAIHRVGHAAYNDSGSRIALTPWRDAFRTWKRYRGGRVPPVWIYDPKTHDVEQIPHVAASDTFPCWLGKDVYFASDRRDDRGVVQMNIWKYTPGSGKAPQQITRFTDFGVRNMSAGGGVLAFTVAGAIRLYDPRDKSFRKLKIKVHTDGLGRLPAWKSVKGKVRWGGLSPNGKRAVFEARGEIITVPKQHGAARNLTQSPGVHERSPSWSPDGKHIAWLSDEGGEYHLVVRDRRGRKEPRRFELGGAGFYDNPHWSPDSKHILFNDKGNRLAYVTLDTGKVRTVAVSQGSLGQVFPYGDWSRDSKWIAFVKRNATTAYDDIVLYELATGDTTRLTDGFSTADSPTFSHDGKLLFFRASVNSGPRRFGLDLSASAVRRPSGNLYVVVLQKDGKHPFGPRSDEGLDKKPKKDTKKGKGAKKEEGAAKKDTETKDESPSIDLEGISQRILALPVGSGRYSGLACSKSKLLYMSRPEGGKPALMAFDAKTRKATELVPGASNFVVSATGTSLLVQTGQRWQLTNESGKGGKTVAVDTVKVRVEPDKEWPQIMRECWRIQRDFFYDPQMHQVDWPKMWERWSAFLPHVQHREDLNLLMAEMMGELCCGHEYVYGGDYERANGGINVGLLGADFAVEQDRYRIKRIYEGQNWNPGMRSPLTAPGVGVEPGDFVIAVNGRDVTGADNFYEVFQGTANQGVELTVSKTPDGAKRRTVTVVPLSSDRRLRQKAWVEHNRKRVDELSDGRLAYIYMPNTAGAGLAAFDRDFYSQLDKQGLVLDERFNGGGKVADYVVNVLDREVLCYWMNREGWLGRTPFGTLDGPKVMIINERAGSGGDALPWMFRKLGIGPLVGTRTWGGLVGVSGYPEFVDGGGCSAASFGIMDTDGSWVVENVGVAPDHEVIQWPKDIAAGRDPQLEKAVQVALEMLAKTEPKQRPGYTPPSKR